MNAPPQRARWASRRFSTPNSFVTQDDNSLVGYGDIPAALKWTDRRHGQRIASTFGPASAVASDDEILRDIRTRRRAALTLRQALMDEHRIDERIWATHALRSAAFAVRKRHEAIESQANALLRQSSHYAVRHVRCRFRHRALTLQGQVPSFYRSLKAWWATCWKTA